MKPIAHTDLVDMDTVDAPITVDLVYARADHPENIFKTALYKPDTKLWLHKDLAAVVIQTAKTLHANHNWTLVLKDGLRTVEAQTAMQKTEIVKANPEWCMDGPDRMLSPPGGGGHPRGMAIDVGVVDSKGQEVDMGTPFDHLDVEARRDYTDFPDLILENRKNLDDAFLGGAAALGLPLLPIPVEWWDFRFPPEIYNEYAPVHDKDLPSNMRMTDV